MIDTATKKKTIVKTPDKCTDKNPNKRTDKIALTNAFEIVPTNVSTITNTWTYADIYIEKYPSNCFERIHRQDPDERRQTIQKIK